jgi:hypothetical protein
VNEYSAHTVRDELTFFSNPALVRKPAFNVIDRMDGVTPGAALLGTAVALVAQCEAIGLSPHELIQRAGNVMNHADGAFTYHVKAIRDYARNEILRTDR